MRILFIGDVVGKTGRTAIFEHLPGMVRAIQREGRVVVWSCDPMHGNTITSNTGYKTRPFDRILSEVKTFFSVRRAKFHTQVALPQLSA